MAELNKGSGSMRELRTGYILDEGVNLVKRTVVAVERAVGQRGERF